MIGIRQFRGFFALIHAKQQYTHLPGAGRISKPPTNPDWWAKESEGMIGRETSSLLDKLQNATPITRR